MHIPDTGCCICSTYINMSKYNYTFVINIYMGTCMYLHNYAYIYVYIYVYVCRYKKQNKINKGKYMRRIAKVNTMYTITITKLRLNCKG